MTATTDYESALQPFACGAFGGNVQQDARWQFATFAIRLPEPVLVEGTPGEPVSMGVNLEGFDAEAMLTLNPGLGRIRKQNPHEMEERWYYAASDLEVTVSRRESAQEGVWPGYFNQVLLPEYQAAATEAANRCAAFLRYRLWSGFFSAMERFERELGDSESRARNDVSQRPRFSIIPMEERLQEAQQACLSSHFSPELADLLLAEAQQSILGQRLRRACLELTMACEAAIERHISVAEQLKDAIDDRFKGRHQAAYIGLHALFQARDEADGSGPFRFASLRRRELRREQLKEWGAAVACLRGWMT